MNDYILSLFLLLFFAIATTSSFAQANEDKRTEVEKAHDDKGKSTEFSPSNHQVYKVKLYAVKPPTVNQIHHWFLHVLDANGLPVDYATIGMDAYHKDKKELKLSYMGPITYLCGEGKYVIGFVNVQRPGTWVLDLKIQNVEGKMDTISLEMEVAESIKGL